MAGRYLIDTHVFIELADPTRTLVPQVHAALSDPAAEVHISAVSVAEMCIKSRLGKLTLPEAVEGDITASMQVACDEAGFQVLPLMLEHATLLGTLPLHHRDPFDRLLVAQAELEGLTLVTRDPVFERYAVERIEA